MSKTVVIKDGILKLEAGYFQNLCNAYLSKEGYENIVSLGGQAGTNKTTKGTPDAYFISPNGKYVFVEYTTQRTKLVKKIEEDISKCLDESKTEIPYDEIEEIIYCHTSSDIKPADDRRLKNICAEVKVKLTLIGVDKLAGDLYCRYPGLCRDFLDISIGTDQVMDVDDFIKDYNSNKLAAPIDTEFLFREAEIAEIDKAFEKTDIVILRGVAGSGKTRLALHYAKKHRKETGSKLYCISNKAQPIYEDLKLFLNEPGDYMIVVDDANQLSGLQYIAHYKKSPRDKGYNIKLLITVRDYALDKVLREIREIKSYEIVNIELLGDAQIKELLERNLKIKNLDCQERILNIAEGNARIAMLAGRMALHSDSIQSFSDLSQLYDDYYGAILHDEGALPDKGALITAGTVAFLGAVHLDYIDVASQILKVAGCSRNDFVENVGMLSEKEIVNIYNEKAVRFSDQCFANYILKHVFFDRKLISLSNAVYICFQYNRDRTVFAINTLLNVFRNEDLINFVLDEIKKLWDELESKDADWFFEFVKVFFRINPTKTLIILNNKIEHMKSSSIKVSDCDMAKDNNRQKEDDGIIEMLGGFADMEDLPTALDLFFKYYLKRPDLFRNFCHAANLHFSVNRDSIEQEFNAQILFLEKIKEYSNNWQDESIIDLFLEVAEQLLKFKFTSTERGRKDTFVFYNISMAISSGVKEYRKKVWQYLIEIGNIVKESRHKEKIRGIIAEYGDYREETSLSVMYFDLIYIKEILKNSFPFGNLKNAILVYELLNVSKEKKLESDELFSKYLDVPSFKLYRLLVGNDIEEFKDYKQKKKAREQCIRKQLMSADFEVLKSVIDMCDEYGNTVGDYSKEWKLKEGLSIALSAISRNKELYIKTVAYYLEKNTPLNIDPCIVVNKLFLLMNDDEVFKLINSYDFNQRNSWIFAYYFELPKEKKSVNHLSGLYKFLSNDSDKENVEPFSRNLEILDKFSALDQDVFIKGCEIILAKKEHSPITMYRYFESSFWIYENEPRKADEKFSSRTDLLIDIYIAMVSKHKGFDHQGRLLKEIYAADSSVLEKYIEVLVSKGVHRQERKMKVFFDFDNYIDIYNKIVEIFVKKSNSPSVAVPNLMKKMLLPDMVGKKVTEEQNQWIIQFIRTHSNDENKMRCIFLAMAELEESRRIDYVKLFLSRNSSYESFMKIPLTPSLDFFIGSPIPVYDSAVQFLTKLLPLFVGIDWIKHKNYVENKIHSLEQQIETRRIEEFMRGEM